MIKHHYRNASGFRSIGGRMMFFSYTERVQAEDWNRVRDAQDLAQEVVMNKTHKTEANEIEVKVSGCRWRCC